MDTIQENIGLILKGAEEKMQKSLGAFKKDLANIRSTRAASAMLDHIKVDYYGAPTPLNQLASISVPEARMLLVSPYDKGTLGEIEKTLQKSDLGINPQNDGAVIRLVMPELSTERRQELVKQLKARLEEARISLRNARRDANEEVKKIKSGGASEDEIKAGQEDVQKLLNRYIKQGEELSSQKEEAILKV